MNRLNLPTPEGVALGAELARLTGPVPDACDDCAFRLGTLPNGCGQTLLDAIACVFDGTPFLCHARPRVCEGWKMARASADPSSADASAVADAIEGRRMLVAVPR